MKPASGHFYLYVLIAIALGIVFGFIAPEWAVQMKPLGDGFIKLIKMLVVPVVFVTIVLGLAHMEDMKQVGRVGVKSLVYFEIVTTLTLVIGLLVAMAFQPGIGINADPRSLDTKSIESYTTSAKETGVVEFLLNMIPTTLFSAFSSGDMLQVLLVAILFGVALAMIGDHRQPIISWLESLSHVLFGMVGFVMKLAPLGAFGAMAFTIGKFGLVSLIALGKLMLAVYVTCFLFVVIVLGAIARWCGLSLWSILKYFKEEFLIVLGTSSSESVLPRVMKKLEAIGVPKPIVGMVVPTGYSFNLDGTSIYLTMAVVFIAQATNTEMTWMQLLTLLALLMLTSKGAAAVTGGGFITLAATLSAFGGLPVAGIALLLGVDRFMSEARALTNLAGNCVATLFIAKWENALDLTVAQEALAKEPS